MNERGNVLIGTLAIAGLGGAILATVFNTTVDASKNVQRIVEQKAIDEQMARLQAVVSNSPNFCARHLEGRTLTANKETVPLTALRFTDPLSGAFVGDILAVNQKLGLVTVKEIHFIIKAADDLSPPPSPTPANPSGDDRSSRGLYVQFENTGGKRIYRSIGLDFTANGAGAIIGCTLRSGDRNAQVCRLGSSAVNGCPSGGGTNDLREAAIASVVQIGPACTCRCRAMELNGRLGWDCHAH